MGTSELCACSCGLKVPVNRYFDKRKGEWVYSKYIRGHNRRGLFHPNLVHWGENNGRWKGGKVTSNYGYIQILCHGHPRANNGGYVKEHILVMERHLNRHLLPFEIIHHINQDRTDNRIENLQLVTKSEHARLHCKHCRETIHPWRNRDHHTYDLSNRHITYWIKKFRWLFNEQDGRTFK